MRVLNNESMCMHGCAWFWSMTNPSSFHFPVTHALCIMTEPKDRDFEGIIRQTLEGIIPLGIYPRTSIMVVLQVKGTVGIR